MSIYYLYIKTHKNTGLKYLGQTKKENPYVYEGSGVDWNDHLDHFGREHSTEILLKTTSFEELKYWGRHYSKLYRVTSAVDDFGNRIWANRIPETGGGSGEHNLGSKRTEEQCERIRANTPVRYGEDHPGFDNTVYAWKHIHTGNIIHLTRQDFIKRFNVSAGNVCEHLQGNRRFVADYFVDDGNGLREAKSSARSGSENSRYDPTVYVWHNTNTGEVVRLPRIEFIKTYKMHSGRICDLIHKRIKTSKGWVIIDKYLNESE
jgi:hypothetical protein